MEKGILVDSSVTLQRLPVVSNLPDLRSCTVAACCACLVPDMVSPTSAAPTLDMNTFTVMYWSFSWHCSSLLLWWWADHDYVVASENDVTDFHCLEWVSYFLRVFHV